MTIYPEAVVEVALSDTLFTRSPTWTDVSAYVQQISIDRGRSRHFDDFEPGETTIVFDNSDGRFDPNNASGPYWSGGATQILPMRQVRIRARLSDAAVVDRFRGWSKPRDGWSFDYTMPEDATATVQCFDGLPLIARHKADFDTTAGTVTSDYIEDILDDIGFVSTWYDTDATILPCAARTEDVNALQLISQIVATEGGAFFCTKDMKFRFDRLLAVLSETRMNTAQATFGDSGSFILYEGPPRIGYMTDIANIVRITPSSETVQKKSDSGSRTNYGPARYEATTLHRYDNDAAGLAEWELQRRKEPFDHIDELSLLLNVESVADQTIIFGLELRDRVRALFDPPGSGTARDENLHVRSISDRVTADDWQVTLGFSPAAIYDGFGAYSGYLELNHASNGLLDTAKLAYG